MLSVLSRPPCALGNNALAPRRDGSLSHAWRATRTCVVSGVHPSFHPLPTHRTWAPAPRWTASLSRLISSERRKPVWAASSGRDVRAMSSDRTPQGSPRSRGASGNAPAACRAAGWYREDALDECAVGRLLERHETKKERMAVRRRLRVLTPAAHRRGRRGAGGRRKNSAARNKDFCQAKLCFKGIGGERTERAGNAWNSDFLDRGVCFRR
jgi:hypothetical protein